MEFFLGSSCKIRVYYINNNNTSNIYFENRISVLNTQLSKKCDKLNSKYIYDN